VLVREVIYVEIELLKLSIISIIHSKLLIN
jgi:hypothetical protein